MSKLFARRLIGTLACVAILFASLVGFIFTRPAVSAEADSSLLTDWTVEENAATPMVDGLVLQPHPSSQSTTYDVADGTVKQVQLDARTGVKLVSKTSGADAEGSDFYFAGQDGYYNGNFEVDFRIISQHTATGALGANISGLNNIDEMAAALNKYTDVLKVTFTFKDSNSGKEVYLNLLAGGQYQVAAVTANVTTDTMSSHRSISYEDDGTRSATMSIGDKNDTNSFPRYSFPARMIRTSFSNAYSYWNTCGNDSVLPSVIGFDTENMQLYGMARKGWNDETLVKKIILDLDDPNDMGGWEDQFSDTDFQGDYTVKFSVERMTPNDTEVDYNGENITYDRYATMMLYEINDQPATAASLSENPPVELNLKLDETEMNAELYEPFTIPTPDVTLNGVADSFEGGTITVTGPDSQSVTYDEDTLQFTPDQKGEYRIAYTLEKQGTTSTTTLVLTAADTTVPEITLDSDIVNEYAWKSDLSVAFGADDVTATDGSGTPEVTVSAVDSANRPVTSPLSNIGRYTVTYTATDANGLTAQITRTITISDLTDPVIASFEFADKATVGEQITLPTVTATDDVTQNLTVSLKITLDEQDVSYTGNAFTPEQAGTYTFEWTVSDAAGNSDKVTKTLVVSEKPDNNSNTWIWIVVGVVAAVVVIGAVVAVVVVKKKKNNNNTQA